MLLLAHNSIPSPHLILVGSLILLLGRKTRAHHAAEPQFGWGRYWLTSFSKQYRGFSADLVVSPFRCGHGWSEGPLFDGYWLYLLSTISESFFRQHFEPWGQERLRSCHWLQLRAAKGLAIPYIGYLELEVQLCGKLMPHCGVLVVRDPPGGVPAQVPGILGMNVIRKCYQELFGQHGLALFLKPCVSEAGAYCAGTAAVPSCKGPAGQSRKGKGQG